MQMQMTMTIPSRPHAISASCILSSPLDSNRMEHKDQDQCRNKVIMRTVEICSGLIVLD